MNTVNPELPPRHQLGREFLDRLKKRKPPIVLVPFNEGRWFQGAYSTIQRTLRDGFDRLSDAQKDECSARLFKGIPMLGAQSFDQELRQLVLGLAEDFSLSVGHSQKLVSILCKYSFAVHIGCSSQVPLRLGELVTQHEFEIPVPIDTIVLFGLKSKYPEKFDDIMAGRSLDRKGRYNYWATIDQETGTLTNDQGARTSTAWSRLTDYDRYWSLQTRVRELANVEKLSPLEFEMRYLWL